MKKNLLDYVKHYKSFLKDDLCKKTIIELNKLDNSIWKEHLFHDYLKDEKFKKSGNKELSVLYSEKISTKEIIMKELWNAIHDYIINLKFNWFNGWQGYTSIRFNKYEKNKKMAEHCDHIQSIFDGNIKGIPILSVLGILNNDYKGGEFIMFKNEKINLSKGDLLIFPSVFLYPHKVEPVKKGTRYSFISWVY